MIDKQTGQNMQQLNKRQGGGTFLGFVLGMVAGLGIALAVAVYVTKAPVQFLSKTVSRSAEQDASELQKNKDWDPNAPLYGKNPARPAATTETAQPEAPAVVTGKDGVVKKEAKPESKPESKPAVTGGDPLGDLAKARAAAPSGADAFSYFVQVGAYRTAADAESQRARLSLAGIETKVSEREQSGHLVFRLRQGPFETQEQAEQAKTALAAKGLETALVRVQR